MESVVLVPRADPAVRSEIALRVSTFNPMLLVDRLSSVRHELSLLIHSLIPANFSRYPDFPQFPDLADSAPKVGNGIASWEPLIRLQIKFEIAPAPTVSAVLYDTSPDQKRELVDPHEDGYFIELLQVIPCLFKGVEVRRRVLHSAISFARKAIAFVGDVFDTCRAR